MFQIKSDTEEEGKRLRLQQEDRQSDKQREGSSCRDSAIIIIMSTPVPAITLGRAMGEMRYKDDREQRACTITCTQLYTCSIYTNTRKSSADLLGEKVRSYRLTEKRIRKVKN